MTRFKVGRSKSDDVVGGKGERGAGGGGEEIGHIGRYSSFPFISIATEYNILYIRGYVDQEFTRLAISSFVINTYIVILEPWKSCSEGITKVEH
jgi:hypothetical protein